MTVAPGSDAIKRVGIAVDIEGDVPMTLASDTKCDQQDVRSSEELAESHHLPDLAQINAELGQLCKADKTLASPARRTRLRVINQLTGKPRPMGPVVWECPICHKGMRSNRAFHKERHLNTHRAKRPSQDSAIYDGMLRILTEEAKTGIRRVGSTNLEQLAQDAVICRELLQAHWPLNGLVEGKQQMQRRLQCGSPRKLADLIPIVHAYELQAPLPPAAKPAKKPKLSRSTAPPSPPPLPPASGGTP